MKKILKMLLVLLAIMVMWTNPVWAGPITLWGIDAEDGGVGGHGPIAVYQSVLTDMLSDVTNGGSGILVIGGKAGFDTGDWWTALAGLTPVTLVSSAASISAESFAGYALIGVASNEIHTFSGGLTAAESAALIARAGDIAGFVNAGGGLMAYTQAGFAGGFDFVGGLGAIATLDIGGGNLYDDITPTAAGALVGITDDLDVCCWHNVFTAYPGFLDVLATNANSFDGSVATGLPAVIGGAEVIVIVPEPATLLLLGSGLIGVGFARKRMKK